MANKMATMQGCCCDPPEPPSVYCPYFVDNKAPEFPLITLPSDGTPDFVVCSSPHCAVFAGDHEPTWVGANNGCSGYPANSCIWSMSVAYTLCSAPPLFVLTVNTLCLRIGVRSGPIYFMQVILSDGAAAAHMVWEKTQATKFVFGDLVSVPNFASACDSSDALVQL